MLAAAVAAVARAAQDPIALARAGTAAIENRRFGDALEAFTRAAAIRPGDASLCFGAGVAAFMLGQDDVAQSPLRVRPRAQSELSAGGGVARGPALSGGPSARGDLDLRNARQRSPDDRELQDQLDDWRKEHELQSRFHEVRTEHFTALFEAAADEPLAREVVERLEAAYWRVGNTLGVYPSQPIIVVLYTREQFGDITRLAAWSAAAYDGRIRVPLGRRAGAAEELDRVLSHEFVHAVVAMLGGRTVPAWVNEGLATVLEPAGLRRGSNAGAHRRAPGLSKLHRSFVGSLHGATPKSPTRRPRGRCGA